MAEFSSEMNPKTLSFAHNKNIIPQGVEFHLHDGYEIYFFISGKVNYFVEKNIYPLTEGDLMIMNSKEIHKPTFTELVPYERYTIHFSPSLVLSLNNRSYNLLKCFENRKSGENNRIRLDSQQKKELLVLLNKIEKITHPKSEAYDILSLCYLIEILVLLNTAFSQTTETISAVSVPKQLTTVLDYIDLNLDSDLSLETLESRFFINRFYLCRLFKSYTGSSIHEYILYKRVSRAKVLLSEGISVTDTCLLSGFGDYSNFIRTFKNKTGITPGQFAKSH